MNRETMDLDTIHDYVIAHGFGAPTDEGYQLAELLWSGDDRGDYATIAFEIVSAELTEDFQELQEDA